MDKFLSLPLWIPAKLYKTSDYIIPAQHTQHPLGFPAGYTSSRNPVLSSIS
jgi:hypothetical protein